MKFFEKKINLALYSLLVSIFTLLVYNVPFFQHLVADLEGGFNGVVIFVSAVLLLSALNYLACYLLVFLLRKVGRFIVAFSLLANGAGFYFITNYDTLITDAVMGSFFKTQDSEASAYFSVAMILYILLMGLVPAVIAFLQKVDYGSWKRFFAHIGMALAVGMAVAFGNMTNWPWIDRNSTELGSLILPWSYTVNTVRFYVQERQQNVKEIPLPDPVVLNDSRDVCVLVIGESVRRDHCSLYGYAKQTNPYTVRDSVAAFVADAAATYTIGGVRAILEPCKADELYEILPNYLQRAGADVVWRTSNWGEPPVHTAKYYTDNQLKLQYPEADARYDGLLLEGLREEIASSDSAKVFVVVHLNSCHGPAYNTKYPKEFEVFTPVNTSVEMSKVVQEELMNAYDNSVVYTDFLVHSIIEMLRGIPERRSMVLFVSDHGESLGENKLYMHGMPMSLAPREQIEIPFVVWAPDMSLRDLPEVEQYHVFHSVCDFLGIGGEAFDKTMSIFN